MKELIRKAQSGDPEAFIQLIELNKQSLYKVAKGYFSECMDAEDAISDTVMICWEQLPSLRKPEYFKTWLIRILINRCNDIKRKQKNVVALDSLPEIAQRDGDPGHLDYDALMDALSDTYRVVLILFYSEGFKAKEISGILNLPIGTVTSRLKRGREQLAAILKGRGALE